MTDDFYTLYGDHRSGNCYKVVQILSHTGREFKWVETDVLRKETRSAAFLTDNPNGKVPLLKFSDGRCLAESNAMLIHLAEGTSYLPEDSYQRALVYQWLFFEQYSHEPYIAVLRFLLHFDHGLVPDASRIAMLKEKGEQALGVMDKVLSDQDFISGDVYTIADIALYAYTHVAVDGGFDIGKWPAVTAWLSRTSCISGHFDMLDMPL